MTWQVLVVLLKCLLCIGNNKASVALAFAKKLRHSFGLHLVILVESTFLPSIDHWCNIYQIESLETMAEDVSARDCIDSTIPVFPVARISKEVRMSYN